MEEKKTVLKDTLEKLEEGVASVFTSESYRTWLETMARFHHYSVNNCILIMMQRPTAQQVASYETWRKLGRYVKKGERGIKILVPTPVKVKREGASEEDASEESKIMRYKVGHVFSIDQTDGKELPTIGVAELVGDCEGYEKLIPVLMDLSPVPVRFAPIEGSAKGYYDPTAEEIIVKEGMSEVQTIKNVNSRARSRPLS